MWSTILDGDRGNTKVRAGKVQTHHVWLSTDQRLVTLRHVPGIFWDSCSMTALAGFYSLCSTFRECSHISEDHKENSGIFTLSTMKLHWIIATIPALTSCAFTPVSHNRRKNTADQVSVIPNKSQPRHGLCSTASSGQSEVERLLQRARELRESALQAEHQVHVSVVEKKAHDDEKIDNLIHTLFFDKGSSSTLVDRLHEKNLSIETLERIVDRLDEREVIAEGKEHVRLVNKDGKATFERVSLRDDDELARVQGKIEELIEGVAVLDDEIRRKKNAEGENRFTHTETQHWGCDKRAERLTNRAHEIRREREEQFQKRLEEFYEAQRIKKDRPAPPKVKDDHGLVP